MRELHIDVKNKIATYNTRCGSIVCGNNDYRIRFTFDEEWDEYPSKQVRFIWNGKYIDVVILGDTVPVPMLSQATSLTVGVYAGEKLYTTTPAKIPCMLSILCESDRAKEADYYEVNGTLEHRLPVITPEDQGKLLQVNNGVYELRTRAELTYNEDVSEIVKGVENKVDKAQALVGNLESIVGGNSWVLNNIFDSDFTHEFNFISNGKVFVKMQGEGSTSEYVILYTDTDDKPIPVYNSSERWLDKAYQTVFTDNVDISLADIATKTKTGGVPDALFTKSKTLVGAINEVYASRGVIVGYKNDEGNWFEDKELTIPLTVLGDNNLLNFAPSFSLVSIDLNFGDIWLFDGKGNILNLAEKLSINVQVNKLGEKIKEFGNQLDPYIGEAGEKLQETVNQAGEWLDGVGTDIKNWMGDVGEGISNFGEAVGSAISNANQDLKDGLGEAKEWIEGVGTETEKGLNEVKDFLTGAGESVSEFGKDVFNNLSNLFTPKEEHTELKTELETIQQIIVPSGMWKLNDVLQTDTFTHTFDFESNGVAFDRMTFTINNIFTDRDGSLLYYDKLTYRAKDGSDVIAYSTLRSPSWGDGSYQTIIVTSNTDVALTDIAEKLQSAESQLETVSKRMTPAINEIHRRQRNIEKDYQPSTDNNLNTEDKTIVGAINEVNDKVGEGIDTSNLQTKTDATLKTTNKTIVGAINELNEKVGNGGEVDTSNLATVDKISQIDLYSGTQKIIDVTNYGIRTAISKAEVELEYDDENYDYHNLDVIAQLPIVAGNNVEFEVDEENQVVKINATGGGGSVADDGFVGTWVLDENPTLEYGENEYIYLPFNFTCDGVSYECVWFDGYCLLYTVTGGGDNQEVVYDVDSGWYEGDKYRNITIPEEPSIEASVWLKGNGKKQGGSSSNDTASGGLEMPQIRFTSANGYAPEGVTTFYVDEENQSPLKLTVEIVGGGALQVGDALQVCIRKRFNGSQANGFKRKYKLKRFAEYVVTEEDLNKRYLTVATTNSRALFRDGKGSNCDVLSPLYLRIRRPKGNMQNNESGQTVDAEFSNIVTVWKTHMRSFKTIKIL